MTTNVKPIGAVPPVATGSGNMADPHTEPSLTAATVTVGAGAHLVVHQVQTDCCFAEGSISYLVVRDAGGTVVSWREFQVGDIGKSVVGLDVTIDPGSYSVDSFQRPCDGDCSRLDPPTVQCSRRLTLHSGQPVQATVRFSVQEERCVLTS